MPEPEGPREKSVNQAELDAQFAEAALRQGLVTKSQLEEAIKAHKTIVGLGLKRSLSEILVEKGLMTQVQAESIRRAVESGGEAKIVAGFELLEKLGEGGMGVVYKAKQLSLDRTVALKILPERLGRDREFVARFMREARIAARLDHVNIVRALDVGESGGVRYFAMEFVEGEDVGSMLDKKGRLSEDEAIHIIIQAARALEHAWQHQLIHRDIKPDNILVTKEGVAKVADLGLARSTDENTTRMTVTGTAMGTPHYISPEQARGEADLDIRTDIYSLGVTFFHMLAGHPPFQGSTAAVVITRRLTEDPPWIRDVVPEVSEGTALVIRKMMARDREERYANPTELLHDLELIADNKLPEIARGAPGVGAASAKSLTAPFPAASVLRAQGAPQPAARKPFPVGLVAALGGVGAVVLAGVVAAALVLSRAPAVKEPATPSQDVEPRVRQMLEQIDELARKGELDAAILKAETARASYEGTPHAERFAGRLAELRELKSRADREAAAKDLLGSISALRESGNHAKALELARNSKGKYDDTASGDALRKQLAELEDWERSSREAASQVASALAAVEALEEAGSLDKALERARSALEKFAASGQAGRLEEAAKRLEGKLAAKLEEEARRELAELELLASQGAFERALARAEEAARKYASTPSAQALAALAGRLRAELAARAGAESAPAKAKRLLEKASEAMRAGRFAEAEAAYEESNRLAPSDEAARGLAEARFRRHMENSLAEEKAGRLAQAIAEVNSALAVRQDAAARARLAELERRQRLEEALAEAKKQEEASRYAAARAAYARALAEAKDDERAEIQAAISRMENALVYAAAIDEAKAHADAKRWKDAEKATERALAVRPGDAAALTLLSWIRQSMEGKATGPEPVATASPAPGPAVAPSGPAVPAQKELAPPPAPVRNSIGMLLVLVPAGEYVIGDNQGQSDEKPAHKVRLDAYYIGLHEVTNAQFEQYNPRHERTEFSPGPSHPVVNVTWQDAVNFCAWLSRREKAVYRLPTEAEWEAAARGPDARPFPWGTEPADEGGFFRANWGQGKDQTSWARDGFAFAAPVGSFPRGASPFGVLDMAGNVWEWCLDWYDPGYYARGPAENPRGPARGAERVIRGGSWYHDLELARSANRHKLAPDQAQPSVGFRVVKEAGPAGERR